MPVIKSAKLPPQALELEEAVIGACLVDSRAADNMFSVISNPDVFYIQKHQLIFSALKSLYDSSSPIDFLTVSEELSKSKNLENAGGDFYLIELTRKVGSSAHIEFHSRIILQKYIGRQVIKICSEGIENAYSPDVDVFDLIDSVTSGIDKLTDTTTKGHSSISWSDAVSKVPKRVEFLTNNQGVVTGIPTGLNSLDKHFNGWQNTDFIVIGADNGMGKTALVMCHMLAAAEDGNSVGMFSMEMSVTQLAVRAIATQSQFHMNQLMRNGFEHDYYFPKLTAVVDKVKHYPIHIDDQPALTVPEMKRKARAMKRKHNIKLLVIDFVQMFSGDKDIRLNISEAARECKNLAKELNIPVIALSQLSREVKRAQYSIPSKHHLKESSAIEEAADVIALLYRPGYYGYNQGNNPDLYETLGLRSNENACLLVAKNRNGALGNVGLNYVEDKTKFINPEDVNDMMVDSQELPKIDPETDNPF